jgi:hypothetical protein
MTTPPESGDRLGNSFEGLTDKLGDPAAHRVNMARAIAAGLRRQRAGKLPEGMMLRELVTHGTDRAVNLSLCSNL